MLNRDDRSSLLSRFKPKRMKYLVSSVVLMLMLSIGMSLSPRRLLENWGRLTLSLWARLLAGTFLLPPLLALTLGNLLPLGGPSTAGLFLIAAVPGSTPAGCFCAACGKAWESAGTEPARAGMVWAQEIVSSNLTTASKKYEKRK